jgi:Mrp family chromosome partitioning ATPase
MAKSPVEPQLGTEPGLLTAMRQHPILLLLPALLLAGAGYGATQALPKTYSASAEIFVANPADQTIFKQLPNTDPTVLAQQAADLMQTTPVLDEARALLHSNKTDNQLKNKLTISPGQSAPTVTIAASAANADAAAALANAEARAYMLVGQKQESGQAVRSAALLNKYADQLDAQRKQVQATLASRVAVADESAASLTLPTDRARQIQSALASDGLYQSALAQMQSLSTSLAAVRDRASQVTIDAALIGGGVDNFIPATAPSAPVSNAIRNAAIGAAIGLLLGATLAWRRAERIRRRGPSVTADALDAPLIGHIRHHGPLSDGPAVVDFDNSDEPAENFKAVLSALLSSVDGPSVPAVFVTSAHPGEGRSTVALNLAAAADQFGFDPMLIDADRNTGLSRQYGNGRAELPGGIDGLGTIRYGQNGSVAFAPSGVLPSATSYGDKLAVLARRSNSGRPLAVIDTPPGLSDPQVKRLAAGSGVTLVVASPGTNLEGLRALRVRAQMAGVPVVGFIINSPQGRRRRTALKRRPKPIDLDGMPRPITVN